MQASADAGIIVVSALAQELATGCGAGGQTREHIEILHGMGIGRLIVAVTKMDEILHDEAESVRCADVSISTIRADRESSVVYCI